MNIGILPNESVPAGTNLLQRAQDQNVSRPTKIFLSNVSSFIVRWFYEEASANCLEYCMFNGFMGSL